MLIEEKMAVYTDNHSNPKSTQCRITDC